MTRFYFSDRQYEIRMSQSQGNVNVRAQIITKPGKCGNQLHQKRDGV